MGILKTKISQLAENPTFRIFLIMLLVWVVGSFSIILFENGDLADAGNAIWWTIVTITTVGYGDYSPGPETNEVVANIVSATVERVHQLWEQDNEIPMFPWLRDSEPTLIGLETSGRQDLWGSLGEVLEVVNHVEGVVPVINFAHIHSRGHGRLKTSEDYGELFDQVRETIGTKEF